MTNGMKNRLFSWKKVCFGLIEEIYEKIFATGYCNIKNSGKQE